MRECRRHSFCWEKRQRSAFLSCCQFSFWSCMSLVHSSLKSQELTKRKLMKLDFFLSSSHLLYSITSSFYRISFVNLCVILSHTLPFNDNLFPVILDKEWEVKFHGDLVLNTKLRESKGVDFIDCMPFCSRKHWPDSQVAASGKKTTEGMRHPFASRRLFLLMNHLLNHQKEESHWRWLWRWWSWESQQSF